MVHTHHHDGQPKRIEELLGDIIWQNAVSVWQRALILQELQAIKEGQIIMANEQVAAINTKFDEIQAALEQESQEIQAAIAAAREGDATPEELTALEMRAEGIRAAVAALVTPPAPPEG